MIAKVCDICGKVETPERRNFHTLKYERGILLKQEHFFHICPECMELIKELRAKQKGGEQ